MAGWKVLGVYEREGKSKSAGRQVVASLRLGCRLDHVVLGEVGMSEAEQDEALRLALVERGAEHPSLVA